MSSRLPVYLTMTRSVESNSRLISTLLWLLKSTMKHEDAFLNGEVGDDEV
ncbi:hypothetical protein [Undibacterium sp. TC4M20W]